MGIFIYFPFHLRLSDLSIWCLCEKIDFLHFQLAASSGIRRARSQLHLDITSDLN